MEQALSSTEVSTDEDKDSKLSLGLSLIQDAVGKLSTEIKLANKKIKLLEKKYQEADKRAKKWEKQHKDKKKANEGAEEEIGDEIPVEDDRKPAASTRRAKRARASDQEDSNKRNRREPRYKKDDASEENGRQESNQRSTKQFNALDGEIQEWISAIGLSDAYGCRDDGLAHINVESYVGPASFEKIFILTDFLFPLEEGKETHHWRLFKKESRPGIKVRQALRRIKEKNPSNPMICWHKTGGQWIPPTPEALTGIVKLIVDL